MPQSGAVILAGTIRVAPERLADLRPHLKAQVEGSRGEPGCLDYALSEDPLDPGLIRVYEHFVDEAALAFHRASPHMAAWRLRCAELGVHDRNMASFDVSDYRSI
ncbi:putative quinol monooxygenase [soil metagenome]